MAGLRKMNEMQIDVGAQCPCCSFEGLDWQNFLEHFDADAYLPERGKPVHIVVRFTGGKKRGPKGVADRVIRDVQHALFLRGAVRLLDDEYQSTGFVSRACGNSH